MTLSRGEVVMEEGEDERLGRPRPLPEVRSARSGAAARQAADRSVDLQLRPLFVLPRLTGEDGEREKPQKATSPPRDHDLKLAHTDRAACPLPPSPV